VVERAPPILPPIRHVVGFDDVESDRRLVGIDGKGAVQLLDAVREDVEKQRELRLAADDDIPLQRNALFSLPKKPSSLR
jgi:hypothetical protein